MDACQSSRGTADLQSGTAVIIGVEVQLVRMQVLVLVGLTRALLLLPVPLAVHSRKQGAVAGIACPTHGNNQNKHDMLTINRRLFAAVASS